MGGAKGMLGSNLKIGLAKLDTDFYLVVVQPPGFGERRDYMVR